MNFIDRIEELERLKVLSGSGHGALGVLYDRRRVGKTNGSDCSGNPFRCIDAGDRRNRCEPEDAGFPLLRFPMPVDAPTRLMAARF